MVGIQGALKYTLQVVNQHPITEAQTEAILFTADYLAFKISLSKVYKVSLLPKDGQKVVVPTSISVQAMSKGIQIRKQSGLIKVT